MAKNQSKKSQRKATNNDADLHNVLLESITNQCEVITIRGYIRENLPELPMVLKKLLEEHGPDTEMCLHCVEELTEIPIEDLREFVRKGILKAYDLSNCPLVRVRDFLELVNPESKDFSFLD